jgi:predicted O-methyltransferase YrrM
MTQRRKSGRAAGARKAGPVALARAACDAVEQWARSYFGERAAGPADIEWVEGPPGEQPTAWANSFCPIIYQHRDEAEEFLALLFKRGIRGTGLEIGLEHGGSHMLLRQVCRRVISVERSPYKVLSFAARVPADERSILICGDSLHRQTVRSVERAAAGKVDVLFIDGGHSREVVQSDYMLYRHLVRPGGVVAFHDTANRSPDHLGISIFLAQLRNGELDGSAHRLHDIIRSGTGISYEITPARGRRGK